MAGPENLHSDAGGQQWPQEATEWLMLLREEPDEPVIRIEFETWLASSPDHQREWEQTTHTMTVLQRVNGSVDTSPWRRNPMLRARLPRVRGRRHQIAAFTMAVAAAAVFYFAPDIALHLQADTLTGRHEIRTIALADGSEVVLAPESALTSRYVDGKREVGLLRGEALFKVHHDVKHPFVVTARGLHISDIGTVFDVDTQDPASVTVEVQEGQVAIDGTAIRRAPILLAAGDALSVQNGAMQRQTVIPSEVGAWVRGQLVVHDRSVSEVAQRLSRYARGPVLVYGKALAAEHVTGIYRLNDPQIALQTLAQGQNARVTQVTPWLTVIRR